MVNRSQAPDLQRSRWLVPARAPHGVRRRLLAATVPLGLFVLALGWFCWRIEVPIAWTDEGVTDVVVRRTWADLLLLRFGGDAPLVPYYLLVKGWLALVAGVAGPGSEIVRIRGLSALAAAGSVPLLYGWVSRHTSQALGVLAAVVFVALPGVNRYAQEARPYAVLLFASALSWWSADQLIFRWGRSTRAGRVWWWGWQVLTLLSVVVVHLFGGLQWAAQVLAHWVGGGPGWRRRWRRTRPLLTAMVAAGVVGAYPRLLMASRGTGASTRRRLSWGAPDLLVRRIVVVDPRLAPLAQYALLVLVLAALLGLRGRRRLVIGQSFVWLGAQIAGGLVLASVAPRLLRARYWLPVTLPVAVLAAMGIWEIGALAAAHAPRALRGRRVVTGAVGVALVTGMLLASVAPANVAVRRPDAHGLPIAATLTEVERLRAQDPRASTLVDSPSGSFYFAVPAPPVFRDNVFRQYRATSRTVWPRVVSPARMRAMIGPSQEVIAIRFLGASRFNHSLVGQRLHEWQFRVTKVMQPDPDWRVQVWQK